MNHESATTDVYDSFFMHTIQLTRQVEAAFANHPCQVFHLHDHLFPSGRADAVKFHKPRYLVANALRWNAPRNAKRTLALCADDIEQIDTEYHILSTESQHFRLFQPDETTISDGTERLGVVDLELQDVSVLDGVHDRVGVEPVAEGLLGGQDHPLPGGRILREDRRPR